MDERGEPCISSADYLLNTGEAGKTLDAVIRGYRAVWVDHKKIGAAVVDDAGHADRDSRNVGGGNAAHRRSPTLPHSAIGVPNYQVVVASARAYSSRSSFPRHQFQTADSAV